MEKKIKLTKNQGKISYVILNSIPTLLMIILIPFIKNDYVLSSLYIIVIAVSFFLKYEKREYITFLFGLIIMIISESLFISTGVETFNRNSLFGIMPLWLPLLWAYSFVAIKRSIKKLNL